MSIFYYTAIYNLLGSYTPPLLFRTILNFKKNLAVSKTFFTFDKNQDIYWYKQFHKMEAMEKTMTVELTESQYNHIQEILKMDKPSRTRLTSEEKGMMVHMCSRWHEMFTEDEYEANLIESIKKKMSK